MKHGVLAMNTEHEIPSANAGRRDELLLCKRPETKADGRSAGKPARTLYLRNAAWMICAFMSSLFFAFLPPAFPGLPAFFPAVFLAPNPVLPATKIQCQLNTRTT